MPPTDEPAVFGAKLREILDRFAEQVSEFPPGTLDERVLASGNTATVIVSHVAGSTRGWVVGVACGIAVPRDRAAEFAERGATAEELIGRLRAAADEIEGALATLDPGRMDEIVTNPGGASPPVPIARRAAILHATAHACEHLGELMLIKDLLRERAGA